MIVLGLITCIVLRAFTAQAKVVSSFAECKEFFYKGTEPRGMDQNAKKICQMLGNEGYEGNEYDYTSWYSNVYYATLYSVPYKIPLYSAYTLDHDCSSDRGRPNIWHLEPQISHPLSPIDYMVRENQDNQNLYKGNQAISSDYSGTGYDRGHLNPSCFQCGDNRTATFTLTNAAPMDACFNRNHWKNWESTLRKYLLKNLDRDGGLATAFIVTGTVPDPSVRIPQDREKVTVPSHIWTAVCYKHHTEDSKSLSFGYIGRNSPAEPEIHLMSVSVLNNKLSRLYSELPGNDQSIRVLNLDNDYEWRSHLGTHQSTEIFADNCFGDNNKLNKVMEVFQKVINQQVNKAVQMSSGIQNTYLAVKRTISSDSTPEKKVKVSEMTAKLAFDSMSTYHRWVEGLKISTGSACLITNAKPLKFVHDELRKREVSVGPDAVECLVVPEKQKIAADGSLCSDISESHYSCQCNTGGKTKPCCSYPCLYQDDLKGYRCYSGQKLIECSPPYSFITYKGERCLDDYPCATYGYDYYWCWTAHSWKYCSPPLWNSKAKNGQYCRSNTACANYGSKYKWCYTDEKGKNYDQCCTSDDCYSAVNGQICRDNHPCGYHDKNYLWCYTDYNNNWNYCCTNCSQ